MTAGDEGRAVTVSTPQTDPDGFSNTGLVGKRTVEAAISHWNGRLAALDSLAQQGWHPIETAPQNWSWFLAWGKDIGFIVYRSGPGLIAAEEPDPTHWMRIALQLAITISALAG
jgi:hypothetical protein